MGLLLMDGRDWKFRKADVIRRDTHAKRSHVRLRRVKRTVLYNNERFRLESDDEIYTYISQNIHHHHHHHYLLTSIFEIKSPPNLAISAKIASLLISALTSSSPALTGTVE